MSRGKKWIITAAILLVLGLIICGVSFSMTEFDLGKLNTVKYVTNTYDVQEDFRNINIDADTEEITFVLSSDGKCKVVCLEEENAPHKVNVQKDTLTIERKDKQTINSISIGIETQRPEITVFLPKNEYDALTIDADTGNTDIPEDFTFGSISMTLDTGNARCLASSKGDIYIKTDTGNVSVSSLTASGMLLASNSGIIDVSNADLKGDINIKEDTGKVTIENVRCKNLTSSGDTGSLIMTNVIASGEFNIERNTGNIELGSCDADAIYIKTDTGDVSGTLLTDKVFITQTDTGNVNIPKTISGGKCEITTDTGNITIEIMNK